MTKDVEVLDLALADRLFLSYKRGLITRNALRRKLVHDAGIPEDKVEEGIWAAEQTSLEELEWRVGNPDEPGREEVKVVVTRCPQCNGDRIVPSAISRFSTRVCLHCGGRGFIAERL